MKFSYLFFIIVATTISCQRTISPGEIQAHTSDNKTTTNNNPNEPLLDLNEDSIRTIEIQKLLDRSAAHMGTYFTDSLKLEKSLPGALITTIESGALFSKTSTHAIIKQDAYGEVYLNLYKYEKGMYNRIMTDTVSGMEFTGYKLQDVNNDGFNDFLVNTYGSSGCCLKAFCDVYIYKPDNSGFTLISYFENPTFSPEEKVVRGVHYGYAGHTPMYKYRWNGMVLDTIETVSPNPKKKNTYIIQRYPEKAHRPEIVKTPPLEYHSIEGYDWFLGFGK